MELIPEKCNYFGCSALSLVKLARRKGYRLIAMTESNCFFVIESEVEKFAGYDLSIESLSIKKHLTYVITGYDGAYVFSNKPTYGCTMPSDQKFKGEYYSLL
jgi:hypothetical protein